MGRFRWKLMNWHNISSLSNESCKLSCTNFPCRNSLGMSLQIRGPNFAGKLFFNNLEQIIALSVCWKHLEVCRNIGEDAVVNMQLKTLSGTIGIRTISGRHTINCVYAFSHIYVSSVLVIDKAIERCMWSLWIDAHYLSVGRRMVKKNQEYGEQNIDITYLSKSLAAL